MARCKLHCIGASGNSYKLALYMNCAGMDVPMDPLERDGSGRGASADIFLLVPGRGAVGAASQGPYLCMGLFSRFFA
jgi:hypothetical protein